MSEQEILNKCTDAFFWIEENKSVPGPIQDFMQPYSLDVLKGADSKRAEQQQQLVKDLGLQSSGSLLIDRASAAAECRTKLMEESHRKRASEAVDTAEEKLAAAIMKGSNSAKVWNLGKGIGRVQNTLYDPPELDKYDKSVLDGINKNPALKAEIKPLEHDKSRFEIVVSLKRK